MPHCYDELEKFFSGGEIPGTPRTPGDSKKNDTVMIKASPGEVVLPRSVAQSPDAPERAKRFMRLHQFFEGSHK